MVIYIVGHDKRSKTIELDLTTDEIMGVKYRNPRVLMSILRIYKHELRLTKDISIYGLRFDKKPEPKPKDASQSKDDALLLGACDKDWCNHCRRGDYINCPNR